MDIMKTGPDTVKPGADLKLMQDECEALEVQPDVKLMDTWVCEMSGLTLSQQHKQQTEGRQHQQNDEKLYKHSPKQVASNNLANAPVLFSAPATDAANLDVGNDTFGNEKTTTDDQSLVSSSFSSYLLNTSSEPTPDTCNSTLFNPLSSTPGSTTPISFNQISAKPFSFNPPTRSSIWSPMYNQQVKAIPVPGASARLRQGFHSSLLSESNPMFNALKNNISGPLVANPNISNFNSPGGGNLESGSMSTRGSLGSLMPFPLSLTPDKGFRPDLMKSETRVLENESKMKGLKKAGFNEGIVEDVENCFKKSGVNRSSGLFMNDSDNVFPSTMDDGTCWFSTQQTQATAQGSAANYSTQQTELELLRQELTLARSTIDKMHSDLKQNKNDSPTSSGVCSRPSLSNHASFGTEVSEGYRWPSPKNNLATLEFQPRTVDKKSPMMDTSRSLVSESFEPGHAAAQQTSLLQPFQSLGLNALPDSITPIQPTTSTTKATATATIWPPTNQSDGLSGFPKLHPSDTRNLGLGNLPMSPHLQNPINIPGAQKPTDKYKWSCGTIDWSVSGAPPGISKTQVPIPKCVPNAECWGTPRHYVLPHLANSRVDMRSEITGDYSNYMRNMNTPDFALTMLPHYIQGEIPQNDGANVYNRMAGYNGFGINGQRNDTLSHNSTPGVSSLPNWQSDYFGGSFQRFPEDLGPAFGANSNVMRKSTPVNKIYLGMETNGGSDYDSDAGSFTDTVCC